MLLEPFEIKVARHHAYKKTSRGCAVCHKAKYAIDHIGHSDTMGVLGSGNQFVYQNMKKGWMEALTIALSEVPLPRPCGRLFVEGEMCFPTRVRRDQGNHRFIVEKALGDALQAGGWLEDDDWSRYEFGGLAYRYEKDESWTRLLLFPQSAPALELAA